MWQTACSDSVTLLRLPQGRGSPVFWQVTTGVAEVASLGSVTRFPGMRMAGARIESIRGWVRVESPLPLESVVHRVYGSPARVPFGTRCRRSLAPDWLLGSRVSANRRCGRKAQRPKLFVRLLCRKTSMASRVPCQDATAERRHAFFPITAVKRRYRKMTSTIRGCPSPIGHSCCEIPTRPTTRSIRDPPSAK
jgi:hypothetical protein